MSVVGDSKEGPQLFAQEAANVGLRTEQLVELLQSAGVGAPCTLGRSLPATAQALR